MVDRLRATGSCVVVSLDILHLDCKPLGMVRGWTIYQESTHLCYLCCIRLHLGISLAPRPDPQDGPFKLPGKWAPISKVLLRGNRLDLRVGSGGC